MAAIHKAEGDYDLGQCFATGTWRDDGPPLTSIANRFRVSGSICGSCELVFATCRIKRRFDGVVGYWYFVIERGGLPSEFQPLINELVQNTIAEEKAHQAAAHKWLVPHEQVGFGFGCDADTAETVACLMARLLVVAFENAARKGLKEENAAIDAAGHARAGDIVQRIDELFKRLDL